LTSAQAILKEIDEGEEEGEEDDDGTKLKKGICMMLGELLEHYKVDVSQFDKDDSECGEEELDCDEEAPESDWTIEVWRTCVFNRAWDSWLEIWFEHCMRYGVGTSDSEPGD
jgi:hypothetical protein